MKRFHVHAHVEDLAASIAFYSKMFAAEPAKVMADYAKWMLDDPRINFAISTRGEKSGIDHLGIQADTDAELAEMQARAEAADMALLDVGETTCCYARSDKYWVTDPNGIAWEQFRTLGDVPLFGGPRREEPQAGACCPGDTPRGNPLAIPVKAASSGSSAFVLEHQPGAGEQAQIAGFRLVPRRDGALRSCAKEIQLFGREAHGGCLDRCSPGQRHRQRPFLGWPATRRADRPLWHPHCQTRSQRFEPTPCHRLSKS